MPRLAASVALRIASGTSLALPLPKPTRPFWSPTTTSAAKPKRLPHFTVLLTRLIATRRSANSGVSSRSRRSRRLSSLAMSLVSSDLQPGVARGIGQRLDAAMIDEAATVEIGLGHAGLLRPLSHRLADLGRRLDGALAHEAKVLFLGRGRRQCHALHIVDELHADILVRAVDREAHAPRVHLAKLAPNAQAAFLEQFSLAVCHLSRSLLLLAFLLEDILALVADALALVGLGTPPVADIGRDLSDELLVGALDHQFGRLGRRDAHAIGDREIHVMAVAEVEPEHVALHRRPVTDAADFQLLAKVLLGTMHHVGDDRAGHAPLLARAFGLAARGDRNGPIPDGDGHIVGRGEGLGVLWTLDFDGLARERRGDAIGQGHGLLADTRHVRASLKIPCRALRRRHWRRARLHPTSHPWGWRQSTRRGPGGTAGCPARPCRRGGPAWRRASSRG